MVGVNPTWNGKTTRPEGVYEVVEGTVSPGRRKRKKAFIPPVEFFSAGKNYLFLGEAFRNNFSAKVLTFCSLFGTFVPIVGTRPFWNPFAKIRIFGGFCERVNLSFIFCAIWHILCATTFLEGLREKQNLWHNL